jgi:hypothetical protein
MLLFQYLAGMHFNKGQTPQTISTTIRRKKPSVTDMEEMARNARILDRKRMEMEQAEANLKAFESQFGKAVIL